MDEVKFLLWFLMTMRKENSNCGIKISSLNNAPLRGDKNKNTDHRVLCQCIEGLLFYLLARRFDS